jgi:hypothetical protein
MRPAAGKYSKKLKNEKKLEKLKSSALQGAFISGKIAMILSPPAQCM